MHNECTHTETHTACKGNNNMYDMVQLKGMLFALRFVLSQIVLDSFIFCAHYVMHISLMFT